MARSWKAFKARLAPDDPDRVDWFLSAPFVAIHLSLAAIPWLGWGRVEALAAAATYALGMFFVTAGYHRYFAHRAYETSRFVQFLLALGATCTIQRGVLWWAGHHRGHHRRSDAPGDVHSPRQGWLWSHLLWFLCNRHEAAPLERMRDFARFPELMRLERLYWVPPVVAGALCCYLGGWRFLVGGYLLGVTLLYHATFSINSLSHGWGRQRYPTGDDSRNNALLALITFGEGWHNNHHYYPGSARQGFRRWEVDVTYVILRALESLGLVWDLRPVPARVLAAGGRLRSAGGAA